MKILHVDTGREMRGGQRQVLLLLHGLRVAGHECVLLASAGSPLFESATESGFAVYPAGVKALWFHSKGATLVHAHDARAHTQAALAARVPFLVSRRVAFPVKGSVFSKWKYRKAAHYLAVSQFVKAELERAGIPKGKIDVVYDGVDAGGRAGKRPPDGPAVALASADPDKGRDLVEEAARLAGVSVTYTTDLRRDLEKASMFVYLTRAEGLGSAALLAMAMGIPVIGSDVGGLREALGFGEAGLLIPNDPVQIADAMRRLREDFTLAETLIKRGKQRVAEHFTVQGMVQGTLESYGRALAV